MAVEDELLSIAQAMAALEGRFVNSGSLGLHLRTEDDATFKRLAVEAKTLLDDALGLANNFSVNLIHSINVGSAGFLSGPSLAAVQEARGLIEGAVNHLRRRPALAIGSQPLRKPHFVDPSRLAALRAIRRASWDLARLVRLCEELNVAHENDCFMSVAMLVRAIADHIPPIFGKQSFAEVANNYAGSTSFKKSMGRLHESLRNIADAHLHIQVRAHETLPTAPQVDFRADVDVLLSEIVRILK